MDCAKGLVKQLVLLKFKDDTPIEKIEQLIKGYTNFVPLIDPLKEFHCISINLSPQVPESFAILKVSPSQHLALPLRSPQTNEKQNRAYDMIEVWIRQIWM
ncbi:hypothetical protein AAC387_Pa11g1521 [Persea americana]